MKNEVDFSQTIKALEDLKVALKKMANALTDSKTLRELRKMFKEIRLEETNNYLKYHKRPMKRRRWIKLFEKRKNLKGSGI